MANQRLMHIVLPTGATADPTTQKVQGVLLASDGSVLIAVKKQAAQADSVATDVPGLKTDVNALLAKLRAAGILS